MEKPYKQYVENHLKRRITQYNSNFNNGVSIITCTNKSDTLDNILANFNQQDHNIKEQIIIINKDNINLNTWLDKVENYREVKIFKLSEKTSLGNCLNYAVTKSKYSIVAKFDDDDYYGPKYLYDTIKYFTITSADVIVKASNFVYFVEKQTLAIRTPGKENKFVNFGNGSTIIFKKKTFNKVNFRNISIAEDVHFCQDCIRNGLRIYSTNKYHHIYFRHPNKKNHTWKINDDVFIKNYCKVIGKIDDYISYANNTKNLV